MTKHAFNNLPDWGSSLAKKRKDKDLIGEREWNENCVIVDEVLKSGIRALGHNLSEPSGCKIARDIAIFDSSTNSLLN
jgi:hypothetical protein